MLRILLLVGELRPGLPVVVRTVDDEADSYQPRLNSVVLPPGAAALGAEDTATRRRNLRSSTSNPEIRLAEGDVIVLRGTQEALEVTDMYPRQGAVAKK